jgi:hypothetical protein
MMTVGGVAVVSILPPIGAVILVEVIHRCFGRPQFPYQSGPTSVTGDPGTPNAVSGRNSSPIAEQLVQPAKVGAKADHGVRN